MKLTLRNAIIVAIAYADIFDYPLTPEELGMWIPFVKSPRLAWQGEGVRKKRLIRIRKQREAWSAEKWTRARWVANLLKLIPTIQLVGVTGGLTRSNAKAEDDIDFLIITTPRTLWVTRGLSTMLLDFLRLRRRPTDTKFRNLICLNMFMSIDGLSVPPAEQDLFTAHEVLLMTPIWERDGAYTKFLNANKWVEKFLPNTWERKTENGKRKNDGRKNVQDFLRLPFTVYLLPLLEPLARALQLWYMKKRRSTEVVSDTLIRFHPRDARVWIKRSLGRRLAKYNIPLDKIFYGR